MTILNSNGAQRQRAGRHPGWYALLACGVLWTLWASLAPSASLPTVQVWDKLAHAVNYAVLTLLLLAVQAKPRLLLSMLLMVAFGAVIEVVQAQTGYRRGEWLDLLANTVGVVSAAVAWLLSRRLAGHREGSGRP